MNATGKFSRFWFFFLSALIIDAVFMVPAVLVTFLTKTLRVDLLLIIAGVLLYKSLLYAAFVSLQSRWSDRPQAALRLLGTSISRWAGLFTGLLVGAMLGSSIWAAVGILGFYLLGRFAGPLIGERAGIFLSRQAQLEPPQPDFPVISDHWNFLLRNGPFFLPPLMILLTALVWSVPDDLSVQGIPLFWIRIGGLFYSGLFYGFPWLMKGKMLESYQTKIPPFGLDPKRGVYLVGALFLSTPGIMAYLGFIFGITLFEVVLANLLSWLFLLAWYRANWLGLRLL